MSLFLLTRQALSEVRSGVFTTTFHSHCVTAVLVRPLSSQHKPPLSSPGLAVMDGLSFACSEFQLQAVLGEAGSR